MSGNVSTLNKIPMRFLIAAQQDMSAREPVRLWLFIREFIGSKFYRYDKNHLALLRANGFNDTTIRNSLKWLVRNGYGYLCQNGNFCPLSIHTVCPKIREDGKHKKSGHRRVDSSNITNKNEWKKYLRGQIVLVAQDISTRSKKEKKKARCYSGPSIQGGGNKDYVLTHKGRVVPFTMGLTLNSCQGVSLSILMMLTGKSKSTCSRWRRDGVLAGYLLYECFQRIDACLEDIALHDLQAMIVESGGAYDIDPNLLRTVYINGCAKVMMQVPSQIAVVDNPIFYA